MNQRQRRHRIVLLEQGSPYPQDSQELEELRRLRQEEIAWLDDYNKDWYASLGPPWFQRGKGTAAHIIYVNRSSLMGGGGSMAVGPLHPYYDWACAMLARQQKERK